MVEVGADAVACAVVAEVVAAGAGVEAAAGLEL
jgi:hypothetical protein